MDLPTMPSPLIIAGLGRFEAASEAGFADCALAAGRLAITDAGIASQLVDLIICCLPVRDSESRLDSLRTLAPGGSPLLDLRSPGAGGTTSLSLAAQHLDAGGAESALIVAAGCCEAEPAGAAPPISAVAVLLCKKEFACTHGIETLVELAGRGQAGAAPPASEPGRGIVCEGSSTGRSISRALRHALLEAGVRCADLNSVDLLQTDQICDWSPQAGLETVVSFAEGLRRSPDRAIDRIAVQQEHNGLGTTLAHVLRRSAGRGTSSAG